MQAKRIVAWCTIVDSILSSGLRVGGLTEMSLVGNTVSMRLDHENRKKMSLSGKKFRKGYTKQFNSEPHIVFNFHTHEINLSE